MTLNFGLLAAITVRGQISVVLSPLVCVSHGSPKKLTQDAFLFFLNSFLMLDHFLEMAINNID